MQAELAELIAQGVLPPTGSQLRTYRLAMAATGEYTAFHGGTVALGLAAIVTSVNRVDWRLRARSGRTHGVGCEQQPDRLHQSEHRSVHE